MSKNFIETDRDQQLLMPPDLRSWLAPDHLVWMVIDAVDQMDLSCFYTQYRDDGWGRAAFEPKMMVTLLLYAYSIGVRSAREIERRCQEDIAFRVITANHRIDHATICRFRTRHRAALSELFVSVLDLCSKADMVRPEVIAIDSTKIAANASATKNLTREQLQELANKILDEAERVDAAEDELYGERRGDEIPNHLLDQAARIEWLKQKLEEQHRQTTEKIRRKRSKRRPRVNTTDPDSAVQKTPKGFEQGYNAQLAVTKDQVIVAADLSAQNHDANQLAPMIVQSKDNLRQTDTQIETVVADAGYFNDEVVDLELGVDVLVTPVAGKKLEEALANRPRVDENYEKAKEVWEKRNALALKRTRRREEVIAAAAAGLVTSKEAALELGLTTGRIRWLRQRWREVGKIPPTQPPSASPRPNATLVMLNRFAQPGALETYRTRGKTIEPVFGQLKEVRGMRRFLHRGLDACRCELRMMAAAHNLRKLRNLRLLGFSFA